MAIGNEFVEESVWTISRIGPRNGGVDLGGVGTGRGGASDPGRSNASLSAASATSQESTILHTFQLMLPLYPAATKLTFSRMATVSL